MSISYWIRLRGSVDFIEALYAKYKVLLPAGEGLRAALNEARALADGVSMPGNPTTEEVAARAEQANAIITLADTMRPLDAAGLAIVRYLKQIGTGSTNYGTPQQPGQSKKHFFKDFETELFVLSNLLQAGLPVQLLTDPSDPAGEMEVDGIFVEVKHPDTPNQVNRLLGKFHGELVRRNTYGVFVIALEDAFNAASKSVHPGPEEQQAAFQGLAKEIDGLARSVLPHAARLPQVGGLATLLSRQEIVSGHCSFQRLGDSVVFDQRTYPNGVLEKVEAICGVFAQPPGLFSAIQKKL